MPTPVSPPAPILPPAPISPDVGLGAMILRRAVLTPERPALTFRDETLSYAGLATRVRALAGGLKASGVRPGDRVGYLGFNHAAFIETLFASAALGAIFVPLNYRLTGPELAFIVNDSGLHTLVADSKSQPVIDSVRGELCCGRYVGVDAAGEGWTAFETLIAGGEPVENAVRAEQSDTAIIMYTSGTTGRPKGAMLTHGNFFWNNVNATNLPDDLAGARFLAVTPLFHIGGLNCGLLLSFQKSGHVFLHPQFDPGRVLDAIEAERIDVMFAVPAMYLFMSQHPRFETADLSGLRLAVCGGAPAPEPLLRAYGARNVRFSQGYGLTETAPFASVLPIDKNVEKLGSAGLPPAYTEIRIVDADNRALASGARGEICIRGPNVMKGYWNRPDATAEAIDAEGWFHSGDIGYLDAEGYLFVCDRVKDMVISGGENVYPAEVESALAAHPAIGEVAVIGLPDEKWGEAVTAVAALKPGAALDLEELRAFASERLARYKLPLKLFTVDALPRNPAGKVLKFELRARFCE